MVSKQEAIETLQSKARYHCGEKECYKDGCTKNVELDIAIDIINQLEEPVKPVVPPYIDTWIQGAKYNGFDLYEAMFDNDLIDKANMWIENNSETFAKAWLYGYEVEKEKLYRMKHNLTGEYLCFTFNKSFHSDDLNWYTAIKRTQKEWENMGYWNNNLYEPEEVFND